MRYETIGTQPHETRYGNLEVDRRRAEQEARIVNPEVTSTSSAFSLGSMAFLLVTGTPSIETFITAVDVADKSTNSTTRL